MAGYGLYGGFRRGNPAADAGYGVSRSGSAAAAVARAAASGAVWFGVVGGAARTARAVVGHPLCIANIVGSGGRSPSLAR